MKRWFPTTIGLSLLSTVVLLHCLDVPPRILAAYAQRQSSTQHALIARIGDSFGHALLLADHGAQLPAHHYPDWIGASSTKTRALTNTSPVVTVNSSQQAQLAIQNANPGDVIQFAPGIYRFSGSYIAATHSGRETAPIIVRAETPGSVILEFDLVEGFFVQAPYWQFENLEIHGICKDDSDCEHAFHVVGHAKYFVARNNIVRDFNAHFKINATQGLFPDHGRIEGNSLTNTRGRQTDNSVTPIDIVAASHWQIQNNLIADFTKLKGDLISYGVYAKGGGSDNRFIGNVILCTHVLRGQPGRQVGASLGGGGTGKKFCRDRKCIVEQEDSVISNNLIASCADDGIYLNRAARSRVSHNTLLDTAGISIRFPETSADLNGNLIDGTIRLRDGAVMHEADNQTSQMISLYLGVHSVRKLFVDATALDLRWSGSPPRRTASTPIADEATDLCGSTRPALPAYGAFEDFSTCLRR